ncbi:HAD family hydrolase [Oceaniglobus indicus]|uniref:HAD family hydrolase n=1 Tax=Oceaniglobus indicus TaxID=2047749 RepID=UPI000C187BB3|nr:HAD family hydrolase [Oceaniglobus indicus]
MERIEAVLFDKDGTLFDFQATWAAWCGALLRDLAAGDDHLFAVMAEDVGFEIASGRLRPGSIVVADTPDAIAGLLLRRLADWSRPDLIEHMNARAARAPQVQITPLAPLLDGLRARGLVFGLVTNDAERPARAHLEAAGILGQFTYVAGFDSGHGAKPDAGPLLAFGAATGIPPARTVMVGDSLHDMIAARRAGMIAVAVDSGMTSRADLARHADAVLDGVAALPAWLDQRAAR